jgi:2',3'-cyclic-nucleotide 2'-phosphodiesterase (5'-nucleotidase family)
LANEWTLRAYDAMHLAAVNISFRDLNQLEQIFAADAYKKLRQQYPVIERFMSANVHPKSQAYASPQPYLIQELSDGRLSRPVKIGLVGLTVDGVLSERQNPRIKVKERTVPEKILAARKFSIEDPLTAAKRILPDVSAQADLLIVLAYMPMAMVEQLIKENPKIEVVLVASKIPLPQPPKQIGRTVVATSVNEGKVMGELRIYVDAQRRVKSVKNRYIGLDAVIPDDPEMAELRAKAREELKVVRQGVLRDQGLRVVGDKSSTP